MERAHLLIFLEEIKPGVFDPPLLPNPGRRAKLKKAGRLLDLKVVTAARNMDGSVRVFAAVERIQKWHDKE
jgi:hypothetical protein